MKVDVTTPRVAKISTGHFCFAKSSKLTVSEPANSKKLNMPSNTSALKSRPVKNRSAQSRTSGLAKAKNSSDNTMAIKVTPMGVGSLM